MSRFVLDASVAVAWLLGEEQEPKASSALARLESSEAVVPSIWHMEVRSALLRAERRQRITANQFDDLLGRLMVLPVSTDEKPNLDVATALARRHRLSLYDAVYLELATRTHAEVATLDHALARAAAAEACGPIDSTM